MMMMMFAIYNYIHTHVGPTAAHTYIAAFRQRPFKQSLHHTNTDWLVVITNMSSKVRNSRMSSVRPTAQYSISNHQSQQL